MKDLSDFEKKISYQFKNKNLLTEAFTHRSYLNENPSWSGAHNERLEFLGDAVLELVVTESLFSVFPEKPEGELTSIRAALVNAIMLSGLASELEMNNCLILSRGEAKDVGRARGYILANAFEALVGAIYLDGGYSAVKIFIEKNLLTKTGEVLEKELYRDAKSLFQERAQEFAGITPNYRVLEEWGPDHDKHFIVGVYLADSVAGKGEGPSKQIAEQNAADSALSAKGWK
ncbi:MAG: ribonuclease III [Candidatus Niyogibacteria bacterium RIFCSPLOWO2_01_FULL_45_48]|uniref:Ribonuclease 3 n=2 Tax=Candidatus Niyogiibacteriota TaxID=1817912 RepID=A0A1G2EXW4_9BACT|nr:MAG: ribonuclease III [Candidatus Niyogibacteria bacterium RIFCSPLOWO2_02_FULL_45_13]OGZ31507.1 MAG: ribonuclease III [Candidatus Niyogibacteria bacterium RIFCSPLOWO2_01_FULL_45_48]